MQKTEEQRQKDEERRPANDTGEEGRELNLFEPE
jgi:hypothetical protein